MNPQTLIQHERDRSARTASAAVRTERVAIVDPYSTGAQLAGAFARRGYQAVAVLAGTPLPGHAGQLDGNQYAAVVPFGENTVEVARHLEKLGVGHVVAGTESGVPVADRLADRLGLPGNNPATTAARRDKFAMVQALATAGLPHARTMQAFNVGTARNIAHELGVWPLVVKPADSAGSDHVTIAHTIAEVSAAAGQILDANNIFGRRNDTVIVQEFLSGQQFAVNTVSRDGVHRVVEIWHDRRTDLGNGTLIYDRMDLLDPVDPRVSVLSAYVRECLDALGVVFGPAHSEVMLTSHGPVLIETGARLQGGDSVPLMRAATGTSQADAAVHAALDSTAVHGVRAREMYPYAAVTQLFLQAPADGAVDGDALKSLLSIPGVAGFTHAPEPGAAVRRTVDLLSSPATVYLTADTAQQVNQAYAAVRDVEAAGLYHAGTSDR